jgi:NAD(P)-dependent dehydrogenase (short-subunit alcohol dehydrogenase family)
MLMREWAKILKNDGVKVFAISPGFLATSLADIGAEQLKKVWHVSHDVELQR